MRMRLSILGWCGTGTNRSNSGPRAPGWPIPVGSLSPSSGWIGRRPGKPKLKLSPSQRVRKEYENEKECVSAKSFVYRSVFGGGCGSGAGRVAAERRFFRGQRPGGRGLLRGQPLGDGPIQQKRDEVEGGRWRS